jgi:hypothetical protein
MVSGRQRLNNGTNDRHTVRLRYLAAVRGLLVALAALVAAASGLILGLLR